MKYLNKGIYDQNGFVARCQPPPTIFSMRNINIPACSCAKNDRTCKQNINGPAWSCKKSTYWHIHAQNKTVPAVAQDINVPDVVIFDLAWTI